MFVEMFHKGEMNLLWVYKWAMGYNHAGIMLYMCAAVQGLILHLLHCPNQREVIVSAFVCELEGQ